MSSRHRDKTLESALQAALDRGDSGWVVGDIHGYRAEFEALIDRMQLREGDMVLCLGDLVDRGPDSHGVITIVHESEQIFSLKGNHELIMSQALTTDSGRATGFWEERIGGRETLDSMPGDEEAKRKRAKEWLEFTDSLPTEVVLERFRMAHSGYRIDIPLDAQSDEDRLKSREVFLAEEPLDPLRQIIAGHTPVQKLGNFGVEPPEQGIWISSARTTDERPAAVLIDTGIALEEPELRPRLSAYDLQTFRTEEIERL